MVKLPRNQHSSMAVGTRAADQCAYKPYEWLLEPRTALRTRRELLQSRSKQVRKRLGSQFVSHAPVQWYLNAGYFPSRTGGPL